jgi:hypothetical protein
MAKSETLRYGTLHHHGATGWRWRWQQDRHRYSRRFWARDREAAIRHIKLRMSALLERFKAEYHGTKKEITEGTRRTNKDNLTYFRKFFAEHGDTLVAEVGKGHVARYFAWRRPRRTGASKDNPNVSGRTWH